MELQGVNMKLGISLLLLIIVHIIIQVFSQGAIAAVNSGSLTLNRGEELEINSTAPSIVKKGCHSCLYTASLQNRSSSHGDHLVAVIEFSNDIEFRSGSIVRVFGKYALSIRSENGSIMIQTDVNMTCGEKVLDKTCLGGFTQSSAPVSIIAEHEVYTVFTGLGPGGLTITKLDFPLQTRCVPGSSHGGKAPSERPIWLDSGPPYDKQNITSLLGGSGGSCVKTTGSVAGGGAIELVAEKGSITINSSIRASAQTETDGSKICSGGSGGLIRLSAQRVEIQEQGRLHVEGSNAQRGDPSYHVGGGAGGVIQIISSKGSLAAGTSFLKPGINAGTCCDAAEYGYVFVSGTNQTGQHGTFPNKAFSWSPSFSSTTVPLPSTATTIQQTGVTRSIFTTKSSDTSPSTSELESSVAPSTLGPTASSTVAPTAGPTPEERLNLLMQEVESIHASMINGAEVKRTALREVLTEHKSLASSTLLPRDTQDLCLEIFTKYQTIVNAIAKRDPDFMKEALQDILDAASDCINEKNHEVWKESRQMPNLMQSLEGVLNATVQGNTSAEINYTIKTTNVVAQVVRKHSTADMEDIKIPDYSEVKGESWKEVSDFVLIPKETASKAEGNYTYVFLIYKDVENGLPKNDSSTSAEDWKVSSFVMSCFLMLDDKPVKELSPPALLSFKTSASSEPTEDLEGKCVNWDVHRSVWSVDGVDKLESNSSSTRTVCQTDHFTSFAVLVRHKEIPLLNKDKLALTIITYIGCGVSTAALIITFIILLSIESLSSERHKIHLNLVLSLLLAQVLFLAGIKETSSKVLCKIIAVFLHYFFLTAFTWMLVEGMHLYLKVVQVFKTENVKMVYYYVFGWCFSIIPVGITAALKPDSYGSREICWLSMEDGTVWAFIGPVIAIIAINCFVLFMVVKTVVSSASAMKSSEHAHVKAGIKGLFVLMPILGVGWILGLFSLNESTIVFEYAFAIVNGFQGLLIFLLHCVFNNEVRQAFRRQREKNALSRENDSHYHASFSLSQTGDSGSKKMSSSNSFEKLKARISFKQKKTTKFVQVQPLSESRDISESSLQVKRTFQEESQGKLAVTDIGNEISSLNCPIMEDEERAPPNITHLMSQQTTTQRKRSRP